MRKTRNMFIDRGPDPEPQEDSIDFAAVRLVPEIENYLANGGSAAYRFPKNGHLHEALDKINDDYGDIYHFLDVTSHNPDGHMQYIIQPGPGHPIRRDLSATLHRTTLTAVEPRTVVLQSGETVQVPGPRVEIDEGMFPPPPVMPTSD